MVKWSKTSPFHGGNPSSNLGRVTKEKTFERMSFSFFAVSTLLFVLTKATISRLYGVFPNCREMLLDE